MARTNRYSPTPYLSEKGAHALYWLWTHGDEVLLGALLVVLGSVLFWSVVR